MEERKIPTVARIQRESDGAYLVTPFVTTKPHVWSHVIRFAYQWSNPSTAEARLLKTGLSGCKVVTGDCTWLIIGEETSVRLSGLIELHPEHFLT